MTDVTRNILTFLYLCVYLYPSSLLELRNRSVRRHVSDVFELGQRSWILIGEPAFTRFVGQSCDIWQETSGWNRRVWHSNVKCQGVFDGTKKNHPWISDDAIRRCNIGINCRFFSKIYHNNLSVSVEKNSRMAINIIICTL